MKFHKALALFNVHSETTYHLKNNMVKKVGICYTKIRTEYIIVTKISSGTTLIFLN